MKVMIAVAAMLASEVWGGLDGPGRLDAELAHADSATAVLQHRCETLGLIPPGAHIIARRVPGADKPLTPVARALLGAAPDEAVAYRRVELVCGDEIFSRADNWYRPGRLTPEMNRLLEETETPFGAAVRSLGFTRRILSRERLAGEEGILRYRAVLIAADGEPFSLVVETYTSAAAR